MLNNILSNNLSFFRFLFAEMCTKFWSKAPAEKGALGQMSTNFQVYFIHINFF